MKKYLLALILVLAMALMAMPAFAEGAASAYDSGAINLNYQATNPDPLNGWIAGGVVQGERIGTAYGEKFWCIPAFAVATGDLNGRINSKGYAFNIFNPILFGGENFAGSGAFSKVTGNAWELALAGPKNPSTSTYVGLLGVAYQKDWAYAAVSLPGESTAQAGGGNESIAGLFNQNSNNGGFLSFSSVNGKAWTKGETRAFTSSWGIPGVAGESTAWGFTKNSSFGNYSVAGIGQFDTLTLITNPLTGNMAATRTQSLFSYNDPLTGWGIAGGFGQSTLTAIPNGVKASSHSISYSFAK